MALGGGEEDAGAPVAVLRENPELYVSFRLSVKVSLSQTTLPKRMLTKLQIVKNYTRNGKVVREKVSMKDVQNIHAQKNTCLNKKTDAAKKDEEVAVRESAREHMKAEFTEC